MEFVGDIAALAGEWDALALRTDAPPFARPGWVRVWWVTFGRGELRIVTLRRNDELVAVLPLAYRHGLWHSCSNVHSPVFDGVSAEPEDLQVLLGAVLDQRGRGLILTELDSNGLVAAAARAVDGDKGRLVVLNRTSSPYVDQSQDWEEFEKSMSRSRRRNVRKRRRSLDELGEVTIEAVDGTGDVKAQFEEFVRLEGTGWKVDMGTAVRSQPATRTFYEEVVSWAAETNLLRLSFVRVEGRGIATSLMIDDGRHRYQLKVGFDDEYAQYYPGVLQNVEEIRHALEDGRTFEWGGEMNAVKGWLHNAQHTIEQLALFPPTPKGALARWAVTIRWAAYRRARESKLLVRARDALRKQRSRWF